MILSKRQRLILLLFLLASCVLVALMGIFEKQIVNYLVPGKGWVQFSVPGNAQQIRASVKKSSGGVTICNGDEFDWSDVTVKITGLYNAPYLAQPKPIRAGTCEYVPFSDFAEPSWKRMQMPSNESPVRVELLVDYNSKGYVAIQPDDPRKDDVRP
jgi:hypothetical protein